jgi:hypothetical protein
MTLFDTVEQIKFHITHESHKLMIVIGKKNDHTLLVEQLQNLESIDIINLNLLLTRTLVSLSTLDQNNPDEIIKNILSEHSSKNVILFSNIHILFDINLQWNPLEILKKLSQKYIIVALWDGQINENGLEYAPRSHLEHTQYPIQSFNEILIMENK